MSESTTEVSGGGAISDEVLEAAMKAALDQQKAAHPNEPLLFPDDDGYDLLTAAITAALDASEARAEAAEGNYRYWKARCESHGDKLRLLESRLAAAEQELAELKKSLPPGKIENG